MSDEMIKLLAKKGGVIQINFGNMFVNEQVNKESVERKKLMNEFIRANDLQGEEKERYIKEYVKAHPLGDANISDVVANIDHAVQLVGIDYVGLGSDFDGVGDNLPNGLKDVSCYPNLLCELIKKGYTAEDVRKICSDNFLRVWSEVERAAIELQSSR